MERAGTYQSLPCPPLRKDDYEYEFVSVFDVWYVTWPYGLARCCVILSIKMDAAATNLSMSQSSRNRLTALESMSYNICKLLRALLWFTVLLQRLVDEFQLKSILNFVFTSNIQCALSFVDRFN